MTDYQIVQKMDEMKFSPQDIAAAYGWNEADVVKNYNLAKEVGGYFAGNQGQDDTTYARKIGTAGWKPEDLARITGANLAEIKSRLGTANKFNTLTDANTALQSKLTTATNAYDTKIGLLNTQYGLEPIRYGEWRPRPHLFMGCGTGRTCFRTFAPFEIDRQWGLASQA